MNSENDRLASLKNEMHWGYARTDPSAGTSLPMVLNTPGFVRRPLPVLARLIDDGCGEQLGRIEFADSESIEPCLLSAGEAVKLCAPDVPQLDVHAIGATLAEQEDGHRPSVARGEQKAKTCQELAGSGVL
jgi:hypothetical protein